MRMLPIDVVTWRVRDRYEVCQIRQKDANGGDCHGAYPIHEDLRIW